MSEPHFSNEIRDLNIDDLVTYSQNPFDSYEGMRLDEMIESVKERGVLIPIIVRPHTEQKGKYEILSGHNRVNAARNVGLTCIQAVVRNDLTEKDSESALIVIETNLNQRSFKDWKYSERANAIFMYHEVLKRQGKRTDLLNEVNTLLESKTSRQVGEKLSSDEETAKNFGLSARTVSRYLQVHKLSEPLLERLDNNEFAVDPAINISYLNKNEQEYLNTLLGKQDKNYKLTMKNSKVLRKASADCKISLTQKAIENIISQIPTSKPKEIKSRMENFLCKFPAVAKPVEELTSTMIPNIILEYSKTENPTEEDSKELIQRLKTALEVTINKLNG